MMQSHKTNTVVFALLMAFPILCMAEGFHLLQTPYSKADLNDPKSFTKRGYKKGSLFAGYLLRKVLRAHGKTRVKADYHFVSKLEQDVLVRKDVNGKNVRVPMTRVCVQVVVKDEEMNEVLDLVAISESEYQRKV